MQAAVASMLRDNAPASELAVEFGARACTDVSGFGLAGHLDEMLRASGVGAELEPAALPLLPGALDLAVRGLRSSFFEQNAEQRGALLHASLPRAGPAEELLFDPQTSGGLLIGVDAGRAEELVAALADAGDAQAAVIGRVLEAEGPTGVSGPRIRLSAP
jgi:selenide,water dikinase